ncbi:hypothetical protein BFJ66_g4538 [Fusarium oxysporum f. sp. cepae]|nr:hypothetical protein BFJ66_g4538 [Fusarium oxysporum f. sp. cepae]
MLNVISTGWDAMPTGLDSSERIKLIISSLGVLISRLSFESVLE